MERGRKRATSRSGWWSEPPWWAWALLVVSAIFLIVGLPYALNRGGEPLPKSELDRIAAAAATANEAAASKAVADAPIPAAFIGDSYTAGAGSTTPDARFTSRVAARHNWIESNFGQGGTGYISPVEGDTAEIACGLNRCPSYSEMITEAAASGPQIVIVSGGRNEVNQGDSDSYAEAVAQFFVDLRAALPDARIVATSPVWDDDPAPPELSGMADAVRAGVEAVGGSYLDIGEPLAGHPEWIVEDGTHPNDAGHQALAEAVDAALAGAGLGDSSS